MQNESEVREQQRASWNKFSAGWAKWDDLTMKMLKPAGDAMMAAVSFRPTHHVLDIAAGTGEPGLSAANLVNQGRVISTDLAEDMIAVAVANGRARGLSNFTAKVAGVDQLGEADHAFDVVLCRFGFMFFPNVAGALKEIKRVLKPSGQFSAAVWASPAANLWSSTIMGIVAKNVEMPAPPPDAPGLYRCANPEYLPQHLQKAGFTNIQTREAVWEASYPSVDTYWQLMTEVAAPVVAGMAKADEPTRDKIRAEVFAAAQPHVRGGALYLKAAAHIVTATV